MFNRLNNYFEKYTLLNEKQFGFKAQHSTITAVLRLIDQIVREIDKGNITVVYS